MKEKDKTTDSILIKQYQSGNSTVLPILVKRYHKVFCQKAFWVTKNKDTAKDVAQESWLTIIDKISTLKNVDSFKSWAYRIVYTKAIDTLKHKSKESERLKSIAESEYEEGSIEENGNGIKQALLKAIKQLPNEKQDIIRLFYVEEYSLNEISAFLNIPVGTVKSRLFKAREKLKSILKSISYEK